MYNNNLKLIVRLKHFGSFAVVLLFLVLAFSSKEAFDPIGGQQIWKNDGLLSGCTYFDPPIATSPTITYKVVDEKTFEGVSGINVKVKLAHYATVDHPTFVATCIMQIADFEAINRISDANGDISFTTSSYGRTGNYDHFKLFISTSENEEFLTSRHNDIVFLEETTPGLEYLRITKKEEL